MTDDIPNNIHTKLVCVTKRGRFSHLVPNKVWQAPDGRVIQRLDDADEPLDEDFYSSFLEFEKQQLQLEQEQEDFVQSSTIASNKPTSTESNHAIVQTEEQLEKCTVPEPRQLVNSISQGHVQPIGAGARNPPQAHTALVDTSAHNQAPPASSAGGFTPADCLIHRWDPKARARCFVQSHTAKSTSTATTGTSNNSQNQQAPLEVLLWVRYGCIRLDDNLALQQCQWLRANVGNCTITAIAFCPHLNTSSETADGRFYLQAVKSLRGKLREQIGVELYGIDGSEDTFAAPVFALWTRQTNCTLGVFTSESYIPQAMRVSSAVARSIHCPLFSFDSENLVPIRFLDIKFGITIDGSITSSNMTFEDFKAKTNLLKMPLPTRNESSSSSMQLSSQTNLAVPNLIKKRWPELDWSKISMDDRLVNESLDTVNPGLLMALIRLGTFSALSRQDLEMVNEIVIQRMFLLHQVFRSAAAPTLPASESPELKVTVQIHQQADESSTSLIERLKERNWLSKVEIAELMSSHSVAALSSLDFASSVQNLLRLHMIGYSAAETSLWIRTSIEEATLRQQRHSQQGDTPGKTKSIVTYDDDE